MTLIIPSRLSGDRNPLHVCAGASVVFLFSSFFFQISPEFAAIGGFETPILHGIFYRVFYCMSTATLKLLCQGLCSLGYAGKHILKSFGSYKDIKTR